MASEFDYLEELLDNKHLYIDISKEHQTITWKGKSKYIKPLVELIWEYSIRSKNPNEEIDNIGQLKGTKRF